MPSDLQRPTPPQPPKSPHPTLPSVPNSTAPLLPPSAHQRAPSAAALAKLSNSAFPAGASTRGGASAGVASKTPTKEEPDSPRVEIDSIFANW